jgi:uroporphyrinogen III methyltransferase / synthase
VSLAHKRVLITRPREQSDEFIAAVERLGGTAVIFPLISIADPESWDVCDEAIARIGTVDGLVFTSVNGVEKFLHRCSHKTSWSGVPAETEVFVVGKATRRKVASFGIPIRFMPEEYSADSLVQHFAGSNVRGKRFLVVRGDIGREDIEQELRRGGAHVDVVVAYRTLPASKDSITAMRGMLDRGEIDAMTFASPSAVRNFVTLFPEFSAQHSPGRIAVAVIGPTTGAAAREAGLFPDIIPDEASVESLVQALDEYFEKHP